MTYVTSGRLFPPIEVIHSLLLWPSGNPDWALLHGPSWTLQYELFFYALAAVFNCLCRRNRRLSCAIVLIVIGNIQVPNMLAPGARIVYYSTGYYLEFGAGLINAELVQRKVFAGPGIGTALVLAALFTFALSGFDPVNSWGIPSVMLILGLLAFDGQQWLKHRIVACGGDASYANYMTHLAVINVFSISVFALTLRSTNTR